MSDMCHHLFTHITVSLHVCRKNDLATQLFFRRYNQPSPSSSPTSAAQRVGSAQSIEATLAVVAAGALDVRLALAGPCGGVTAPPVHGSLSTADAACWETGHPGTELVI